MQYSQYVFSFVPHVADFQQVFARLLELVAQQRIALKVVVRGGQRVARCRSQHENRIAVRL